MDEDDHALVVQYDFAELSVLSTQTQRKKSMTEAELLSPGLLVQQNVDYSGGGGVSRGNVRAGFVPAFHHQETGQSVISSYADGAPAPVHVLDGLPDDWIDHRDNGGSVKRVSACVIAGFLRGGVFYTREAAARVVDKEELP